MPLWQHQQHSAVKPLSTLLSVHEVGEAQQTDMKPWKREHPRLTILFAARIRPPPGIIYTNQQECF